MNNLISGKEAKLAWANGEELEFYSPDLDVWFGLNDEPFMSDVFDTRPMRLKPKTITLNGIEVPATFEPKVGDDCKCYHISTAFSSGFDWYHSSHHQDYKLVWKSEDEIKQVVAALRKLFKPSESEQQK